MTKIGSVASLALLRLAVSPLPASAWNIPGHMLSAAIAYQVLQQENPQTIDKVIGMLDKHPWYANQWQARLQYVPVADHDLVLFMQAARWPDDVRLRDKQHHRATWHYINWPFKPEGQPARRSANLIIMDYFELSCSIATNRNQRNWRGTGA